MPLAILACQSVQGLPDPPATNCHSTTCAGANRKEHHPGVAGCRTHHFKDALLDSRIAPLQPQRSPSKGYASTSRTPPRIRLDPLRQPAVRLAALRPRSRPGGRFDAQWFGGCILRPPRGDARLGQLRQMAGRYPERQHSTRLSIVQPHRSGLRAPGNRPPCGRTFCSVSPACGPCCRASSPLAAGQPTCLACPELNPPVSHPGALGSMHMGMSPCAQGYGPLRLFISGMPGT